MSPERARPLPLPEAVHQTLHDFSEALGLEIQVWNHGVGGSTCLFPREEPPPLEAEWTRALRGRFWQELELRVAAAPDRAPPGDLSGIAELLASTFSRILDLGQEIRFFTHELSERYEEINLLYSISETLGSILRLDDATEIILQELCDVLGAVRGSLWVHDPESEVLVMTASVGAHGVSAPLPTDAPDAVTARVFRDGRAMISSQRAVRAGEPTPARVDPDDSFLSVPIRYTPPTGEARTVGVINLLGRRHEGVFTAADQKLLSAVASQVGAALENNRLIRRTLQQEAMSREMQLAHNLQQKLLPAVDKFEGARVAARVAPAELVGGDFYQVFKLPGGRIGVMIGDVSGHGFPAALMMAAGMSAATIYAAEFGMPAQVLRQMDDALQDELENTEMYLTMFYGVLDPIRGTLTYANAGHPHAFLVRADGTAERLLATDPPVGFAGPDSYHEVELPWSPSTDLLFLFTDGLSDTMTTAEISDGEAFVVNEVVRHRELEPSEIVDRLFSLADDSVPTIPSDDRTAILLIGE